MRCKFFVAVLLATNVLFISAVFAQKKVVIMGSSTAVGNGATAYSLSWAGRLEASFKKNTSDGIDTTFYNIARAGYTTYQELPTPPITPPSGKPASDPANNVNKALSYAPDIVIINLPSNDVDAGFSLTESMNNFRTMYNAITASGAKCYITTTQPRNDYTTPQRLALITMRDSINAQFGAFAINFWDDLVTSDGLYSLGDDRRDPASLIHPNNIGHGFLFQRVVDKNIFAGVLPLKLTGLTATLANNIATIKWHTEQQDPNTIFEVERSANGVNFETIEKLQVATAKAAEDFTVTDKTPLAGNSFYRIKITGAANFFYSNTVSITNKNGALNIIKLYKDNSSSNVIVNVGVQKSEPITVILINASGAIVQQKKQSINMPSGNVILPIAPLPAGTYFIKVINNNKDSISKSFIK